MNSQTLNDFSKNNNLRAFIDFVNGTTDSLKEQIGTNDDRDQIYSRELNEDQSLSLHSNKNAPFDFGIHVDTSTKKRPNFFYLVSGNFTCPVPNLG